MTQQIWVGHYTTSNGEECHDFFIASSEEEAYGTYERRFKEEFEDGDAPDLPVYDVFPIEATWLQDGEGKAFSYALKEEPVCRYHTDSPGWDACNDDHVGPCKFHPPPSDDVSKYLPDENYEAPLEGHPVVTEVVAPAPNQNQPPHATGG